MDTFLKLWSLSPAYFAMLGATLMFIPVGKLILLTSRFDASLRQTTKNPDLLRLKAVISKHKGRLASCISARDKFLLLSGFSLTIVGNFAQIVASR